jgi:hypothetical protein
VDVSVAGPHRFQSSQEDNAPRLNMIVEHYESCDFEKYKEKYINLSKQTTNNNIPFPYYNDSIAAAKKGGECERLDAAVRIATSAAALRFGRTAKR